MFSHHNLPNILQYAIRAGLRIDSHTRNRLGMYASHPYRLFTLSVMYIFGYLRSGVWLDDYV